ncbi:hypothetical protein GCM10009824_14060 [Kocuria atrinae]|uniref:Uncharacterized protein n=1 Tax=Kocuria atrinae TaxID=592377 RepID=A0ABN2XUF3_9MICC
MELDFFDSSVPERPEVSLSDAMSVLQQRTVGAAAEQAAPGSGHEKRADALGPCLTYFFS